MYAAASRRSPLPALALTTAAALTLTPLVLPPPTTPLHLSLPQVSAPRLELTAAINPADVTALINNLNAALQSASSTVTGLVGAPGQTLANALGSAATLNDSLWDGLIDATDNRTLAAILTTLKDTAGNGLSRLSNSVDAANGTIVLTTGQLADLLTSTLTGSLGTALHAVATVINNPLALPSYTGLINTPLDIAGLLVTQGIGAVNNLGANVLTVTNTVVTGVTAQVEERPRHLQRSPRRRQDPHRHRPHQWPPHRCPRHRLRPRHRRGRRRQRRLHHDHQRRRHHPRQDR